jgi:hypothetical protein
MMARSVSHAVTFRIMPEAVGLRLIQNDVANFCDYNGLDCLTVANCTTGAQRFFPVLSHRRHELILGRPEKMGERSARIEDSANGLFAAADH